MKKKYLVMVDEEKGNIRRINNGFSSLELLGLCFHTALDIMMQMGGDIKPKVIKRQVVEDKKKGD